MTTKSIQFQSQVWSAIATAVFLFLFLLLCILVKFPETPKYTEIKIQLADLPYVIEEQKAPTVKDETFTEEGLLDEAFTEETVTEETVAETETVMEEMPVPEEVAVVEPTVAPETPAPAETKPVQTVKETVKEPVKETVKEPAKETVKEPTKTVAQTKPAETVPQTTSTSTAQTQTTKTTQSQSAQTPTTTTKKTFNWDDFDDEPANTNVSSASTKKVVSGESSVSGTTASATATKTSTTGATSSSQTAKTSAGTSDATLDALAKMAESKPFKSKSGDLTGTVEVKSVSSDGKSYLKMDNGKLRQMTYPAEPKISIKPENQKLLSSTVTVNITFSVSAAGNVSISGISFSPSAILPIEIQNDIQSQISTWKFSQDPNGSAAKATMKYTIVVN